MKDTISSIILKAMVVVIILFFVYQGLAVAYIFIPTDTWKNGPEGVSQINVQEFSRNDAPLTTLSGSTLSSQSTVLLPDGNEVLLLSRWEQWDRFNIATLVRSVQSIFDQQKRPDAALYLWDENTEKETFLFPGHSPAVSYNRKHVFFERTRPGGWHELLLWDVDSNEVKTIITLQELDPGSGDSFEDFTWDDYNTVRVEGSSYKIGDFVLLYSLAEDSLRLYR